MFKKLFSTLFFAGLLGFVAPISAFPQQLTDLRKLVDDARITFEKFVRNPGHSWLQNNVKFAKGIFIMPSLGKAGYIVGGSLGNGVLLLRDEQTGEWSDPGFYRLVGGTFGLQIGASQSEILALVMTQRGVESLLESTVLLGAGATVAVGPVGGGISGGVSPRAATDFLTFASSKGAMVNLSLGGTVVAVRGDAHEVYYGKRVS
ncbi:MAG: lipid-binding SYLF domain-containing protein, partial [Nitrospirota bacterium]